jgi:hypothetical protein
MRIVALVIGVVAVLLGGLWLVQGLGLVTIQPILCVSDCETLEGPSLPWAVAGFGLAAVGVLAIWFGLKRRRRTVDEARPPD